MEFVLVFAVWVIFSLLADLINYITGLNVHTAYILFMFFIMYYAYDYFKLDWVRPQKEKEKEKEWKIP